MQLHLSWHFGTESLLKDLKAFDASIECFMSSLSATLEFLDLLGIERISGANNVICVFVDVSLVRIDKLSVWNRTHQPIWLLKDPNVVLPCREGAIYPA